MDRSDMAPTPSELIARLATVEPFSQLTPSLLHALDGAVSAVQLPAGTTLFHEGEPGDSLYLLIHGRVSIIIATAGGEEQIVDYLGPGATIGEMALLTGQPRTATVRADEACELVRLARSGFEDLLQREPLLALQYTETIIPRLQRTQAASVLANLFGSLSVEELHELQAQLLWQHLPGGTILFHQGDPGDALYLVLNGRIRLLAASDDGLRTIGEVPSGESLGEWSLLTGDPRSATAQAVRDTEVARLPAAAFERLVERYPHMMTRLATIIVRRQQRVGESSPQSTSIVTFALLPLTQAATCQQVARALAMELAAYGSTLHLTSAVCDDLLGRAGIAQTAENHPTNAAFTGWLNKQEQSYRYIVYEADGDWSAWTHRCVRQADRILLVAHADADPRPYEIETHLHELSGAAQTELVLVHPATRKQPAGTRRWLVERSVATYHHLRLQEPSDLARMARRLTGRAVGLVLSGGGARGFAHIGALRALEEAGIPIDFIGGTSMGAMIGGCSAVGMDAQKVTEVSKRHSTPRALFDYTLPLVSFFSSKKVTNTCRTLFGDVDIEDLWRPYFCIACNLSKAEPVVFERGPLWRAIRASLALPGVFSPVLDGDDVLVDGGILNNLPVEIMCAHTTEGPVIAVDVMPTNEETHQYVFDASISGWRVLWTWLNPWTKSLHVPSIIATMTRVATLNNIHEQEARRRMTAVFIAPDVEQFSILSFRPIDAIIAAGYHAALKALAAWPGAQSISNSADVD